MQLLQCIYLQEKCVGADRPLRSWGFIFTYCRVQYLQPQLAYLLTCCTASLPVALSPVPRRRVPRRMSISQRNHTSAILFWTQTFTNSSQGKIQCINLTNQETAKTEKQTLIHLGSGKNQEQNLIFHLESVTGVQLPSLKARRAAARSCFSSTLLSKSSNAHSSRQHIYLFKEKTCPENSDWNREGSPDEFKCKYIGGTDSERNVQQDFYII